MTGPGEGETDADLMRRVAQGESAACRLVVERHLPRAFGLARRMLRDAAEAEDVAQEAMLRLWRQAARWHGGATIGGWLYQVTHNLAIDRIRRRRPTVDPDDAPEIADPGADPEERAARLETAAAVERAIEALPERQRTAITMVHMMEMTNIDAAASMGVSVEALESLLARGRRSLKVVLAGVYRDMGSRR
jgi:RNA polymerase sigma-70 factor (ECF subfamily)